MYILEGNIGAGKSTFLRLIEDEISALQTIQEPVRDWQNTVYGQSLLTNFYEDTQRWAYTFESLTMICRVQDHLTEQEDIDSIKLIERSIYSGYYCFAQNSYAQGFLSDLEWEIYKEWFSMLIPTKCKPPRGFIYLRTTPEIAYERVKKRNRFAEKTLSFAYLKQIHHRHESTFLKKEGILPRLKKVPVLTLNCDEEFESNPAVMKKHAETIYLFLLQTGAITPIKQAQSHAVTT